MLISIENAEHYIWGENCDGWHLLYRQWSNINLKMSREWMCIF